MDTNQRNYSTMNPYSIIDEINSERPGGKAYSDNSSTSSTDQNNQEEEDTETQ